MRHSTRVNLRIIPKFSFGILIGGSNIIDSINILRGKYKKKQYYWRWEKGGVAK